MFSRVLRVRRAVVRTAHPEMPALSPAFDNPDDAARYAHQKIADRREREYGGFILLRDDGKYVATEPVAGADFQFDPNEVFPRIDDDQVFYPAGHDDYAIYHSHPSASAGFSYWPARERAAYQNSFSVPDMYSAIEEQDLSPASYLSGPDGSLIKYTVSRSRAEKILFSEVSGPADRPHAAQLSQSALALAASTLLPSEFIRRVAQAGHLQVIIGSALWGRPGRVTENWQPYPPATRKSLICDSDWPPEGLALSRQFNSADAAARHVHQQMSGQTHPEIIGVLLKNPLSGAYIAVEPFNNGRAVYAACTVFHPDAYFRPALPAGFRVDGVYFAPATDGSANGHFVEEPLRINFFQPQDLHRLFEYRDVPAGLPSNMPVRYGFNLCEAYFCAPDGALLGYAPGRSTVEARLARRLSLRYSQDESIPRLLDSGALKPADYIGLVSAAGVLRVLEASPNWPLPAR